MKVEVDIDENDIVNGIGISDIIEILGERDILDYIGESSACDYFGVMPESKIQEYIGDNISAIVDDFKDEILDNISLEDIKKHFKIEVIE